ncbi:hypothetical protein GCM10017779_70230 [Streptomyces capillispiralis]|nr:hypothetical protein GCM10017779_70230 [Streptomyces capillispiralis]
MGTPFYGPGRPGSREIPGGNFVVGDLVRAGGRRWQGGPGRVGAAGKFTYQSGRRLLRPAGERADRVTSRTEVDAVGGAGSNPIGDAPTYPGAPSGPIRKRAACASTSP